MIISQMYCCTKSSYVTFKKIISVQFYFRNSVNSISDKKPEMANQNFVTLEVVKELLATQQQAFRLLVTNIKHSVKEVNKDFEELKRSLEISQKDLRDTDIKVTNLESKVEQVRMKAQDQEGFMDYVEDQMEYMENQSRRNNVKILGLREDKEKETSWEETEKIVKKVIRNQLQIKEDIHIERAHRVGKPRPPWQP